MTELWLHIGDDEESKQALDYLKNKDIPFGIEYSPDWDESKVKYVCRLSVPILTKGSSGVKFIMGLENIKHYFEKECEKGGREMSGMETRGLDQFYSLPRNCGKEHKGISKEEVHQLLEQLKSDERLKQAIEKTDHSTNSDCCQEYVLTHLKAAIALMGMLRYWQH